MIDIGDRVVVDGRYSGSVTAMNNQEIQVHIDDTRMPIWVHRSQIEHPRQTEMFSPARTAISR